MASISANVPNPSERPTAPGRKARRWAMTLALVALLAGSTAVRAWQDRRLEAAASLASVAPFPLKNLPTKLGYFEATATDAKLDEKTQQVAGCSDYVLRNYVDRRTGVSLSVFVSFGPAENVVGHSPLVCFPAVGYRQAGELEDDSLELNGRPAQYRSAVYTRNSGERSERVQVTYAFRHAGAWSPDASATRKQFRHNPAMFKIQIQRQVLEGERSDRGEGPSEQFLALLLPAIEEQIALAAAPAVGGQPS